MCSFTPLNEYQTCENNAYEDALLVSDLYVKIKLQLHSNTVVTKYRQP